MQAIAEAARPEIAMASRIAAAADPQSSRMSCSTCPGFEQIGRTFRLATASVAPSRSKIAALIVVDPQSTPISSTFSLPK